MRISDWSSDVCSSDLERAAARDCGDGKVEVSGYEPVREVVHYQHPQERSDDLAVVHCDQQQPIVGTHGAREQRGRLRRVPRQAPQTRSLVSRLGERQRSCHVRLEIGSAAWRERGCPYVLIGVVAGSFKKKL